MLLGEQISIEMVAMVMEAKGKEDPWAMEAMEVVAVVVVAREDSPVEVVVEEDSSELGTGSVLILHVRTRISLERNECNQCKAPKPDGPGGGPGGSHMGKEESELIIKIWDQKPLNFKQGG